MEAEEKQPLKLKHFRRRVIIASNRHLRPRGTPERLNRVCMYLLICVLARGMRVQRASARDRALGNVRVRSKCCLKCLILQREIMAILKVSHAVMLLLQLKRLKQNDDTSAVNCSTHGR